MGRLWLQARLLVHVKPAGKRREGASGRRALAAGLAALSVLVLTLPAAAAPPSALPSNLRVPKDLREHLERLADVSPTFRRQIDLIRRTPRVRITIGYERRRSALIDAETVFEKHEFGSIIVKTTLYLPGDVTELVAHELEHVCEQIEGVELERLAQDHPREAHEFGGRYETRRATLAGRQAAAEFRAHPAPVAASQAITPDSSSTPSSSVPANAPATVVAPAAVAGSDSSSR